GFPAGTMTVNVLGSFLLGASLQYLEAMPVAPELRALVTIGVLGAFTTFSTFSYEAVAMLQDGEWGRAGWYMAGSMLLGIAAVILGFSAGSALLGMRGRP
ncbi:MAG: CrcB family protein, partial [Longimicrobiales bacterium]